MSQLQLIQIVNEDDQPVRVASKQEAWEQGLLHRIVSILVEGTDGRLLLQRRAPSVAISPDTWDSSASGHVDAGETYEQAAVREVAEEIGLKSLGLEEIGYWRSRDELDNRILNRFNKLYRVRVEDTAFVLQEAEVSAVQWFSLPEINLLFQENPDQVTGGLIEDIKLYHKRNGKD